MLQPSPGYLAEACLIMTPAWASRGPHRAFCSPKQPGQPRGWAAPHTHTRTCTSTHTHERTHICEHTHAHGFHSGSH